MLPGIPFSLTEPQEKEGFLSKKEKGFTGASYEKRWVVLHDVYLYFFKNKPKPNGKAEPAGSLQIARCELVEAEDKGFPFSFALREPGDGKKIKDHYTWFLAESPLSKKEWLFVLSKKLTVALTAPPILETTVDPSRSSASIATAQAQTKKYEMTDLDVLSQLKNCYMQKILPIEQRFLFEVFHSLPLKRSNFEAKPMVMLMGQYSVGKTTFIEWLLKRPYLGARIGPEPTTDRFVAIMHGDEGEERTIPGNVLQVDVEKPFTAVADKFGVGFMNHFEASIIDSPILKKVSFIDTPGVLAGEKQNEHRDYDFKGVIQYFASIVDRIIIMFDAHKLDVSDEFKDCIQSLKGHYGKARILLNKADQITTQQLVRVYGSMMWGLGKVINAPEAVRVYIGSFWDKPLKNRENENLFRAETKDLMEDLNALPRDNVTRKLEEFVKRLRQLRAHCYLIDHLKKAMPAVIGISDKQKKLIADMHNVMVEVARINRDISASDFPPASVYQEAFQAAKLEFKTFHSLSDKMIIDIKEALDRAGSLSSLHAYNATDGKKDEDNPFADDIPWAIPGDFILHYTTIWNKISPENLPLNGAQLKEPLMSSRAQPYHLKAIWPLCDFDKKGKLDRDEFILAMWLGNQAAETENVPAVLPPELIPPSHRGSQLFK